MMRKSVLDKVGLYDENIFLYGEESDLCYRIKKDNYTVMFVPDSKIIHLQGGSSQNINSAQILYTSLVYWYRKNISFGSCMLLQIFMCINFLFCFIFTSKKFYLELLKTFAQKLLKVSFKNT